eukprot:49730-Rhodomonas_salina.1
MAKPSISAERMRWATVLPSAKGVVASTPSMFDDIVLLPAVRMCFWHVVACEEYAMVDWVD